ncbi:stf1p [Saccharomyces arboricola H-6]|uniref:ATPase inhibitor, mitochondrial n=1 Tax=Saccharomyces arboricola (strain H-6 / AS 2.3317 / CBS 10644) TaxID=1160507 RepID=J8Q9R8_SACAR|nr:stf1p [Saccharomyces arboricola H-6]
MLNRCISRNTKLPVHLRVASRLYSDGPMGGSSSGGSQDIFIKRERAKEDYYARQQEREQLAHVKEQLREHKKKLETLENKINSLSK